MQVSKATMLARMATQRDARKQEKVVVPFIAPTNKEIARKKKRSFVPTVSSITHQNKAEDAMRTFLAEVNKMSPPTLSVAGITGDEHLEKARQMYIDDYEEDSENRVSRSSPIVTARRAMDEADKAVKDQIGLDSVVAKTAKTLARYRKLLETNGRKKTQVESTTTKLQEKLADATTVHSDAVAAATAGAARTKKLQAKARMKAYATGYENETDENETDENETDENETDDYDSSKNKPNWDGLQLWVKKLWVIAEYGVRDGAEYGRKDFCNTLQRVVTLSDDLEQFITGYLQSVQTYSQYLDRFMRLTTTIDRMGISMELMDAEDERARLQNTRLPLTKVDRAIIDDLRVRYESLREAVKSQKLTMKARSHELTSLSRVDLIGVARPMVSGKSVDDMIAMMMEFEYRELVTQGVNEIMTDLTTSDYQKKINVAAFNDEVAADRKIKEAEFRGLSRGDIILAYIDNKSSPMLIRQIVSAEFGRALSALQGKVAKVSIELNNASIGTYVPRDVDRKIRLKDADRKILDYLLIQLYSSELSNMTDTSLRIRAQSLNVPTKVVNGQIRAKQISRTIITKNIIAVLLPAMDPFVRYYMYLLTLDLETIKEIDNVSPNKKSMGYHRTLAGDDIIVSSAEQVGIIAEQLAWTDRTDGVETPVRRLRGKTSIPTLTNANVTRVLQTLDYEVLLRMKILYGAPNDQRSTIIRSVAQALAPRPEKRDPIKLVMGKYVRNWSYNKRKEDLSAMSHSDLMKLMWSMGLADTDEDKDSNKVTAKEAIDLILGREEYMSRLVTEDVLEREGLLKALGGNASRYALWSLDELRQRVDADDVSGPVTEEARRNHLIEALQDLGNMEDDRYKDLGEWPLDELEEELLALTDGVGERDDVIEARREHLIETLHTVGDMNADRYKDLDEWPLDELEEELLFLTDGTGEIEDFVCDRDIGWLGGKVTGVWLRKRNKGRDVYVHKSESIEQGGHTWYRASQKYFNLQCNINSNRRYQDGNQLYCYTRYGKKEGFVVGYTMANITRRIDEIDVVKTINHQGIKRLFIEQNEEVFERELNHVKASKRSRTDAINDILDDPATMSELRVVRGAISHALMNITKAKPDYGVSYGVKKFSKTDTVYMDILMKTLHTSTEQTARSLFTSAAELIVYLNMPEAKTFQYRVAMEYYLPDIIVTLSELEKYPEVFADPTVTDHFIDSVTIKITNMVKRTVMSLANESYASKNPTARTPTTLRSYFYNHTLTGKRISACANPDRVKHNDEGAIVYYRDDTNNKIYCFTIEYLHNRWAKSAAAGQEPDMTNPDTERPFSDEFVNKIKTLYSRRLASDGILDKVFQKKYGFENSLDKAVAARVKRASMSADAVKIAPDFWSKVAHEIRGMENEMAGKKTPDTKKLEQRDADVAAGDREDRAVPSGDVCAYCEKYMADDGLKTVIVHGTESKIIAFCSFKCYEDKDDWPKVKKAKKKARKKAAKVVIDAL